MKDHYKHKDFLNQFNAIRIFGKYFILKPWIYQKLRYLFPEKCCLCGGRLHSNSIEGEKIIVHGAIERNGKDYYICHLCSGVLKVEKKL